MYYTKLTKQEKQIKLGKLQRAREKMENSRDTQEMLLAWRQFLRLPYPEQKRRREEWNTYYQRLRESNIYLLFKEEAAAYSKNNFSRARSLATQATEMKLNGDDITISQPKHIDPYEFEQGTIVMEYKKIEHAIRELTDYSPEIESEGARIFA